MIGMLQIMIYMLGVYLVFKGVEIFQIAFMSQSAKRMTGMSIGTFMIALAVLVAIGFTLWGDSVAQSVSDRMNNIPNLGR
jgi:uncharacterized membrane protein YecN with MAPEG domain